MLLIKIHSLFFKIQRSSKYYLLTRSNYEKQQSDSSLGQSTEVVYHCYGVKSANIEKFFKKKNVQNTAHRKFFAAYYQKQESDSSLGQSTEEVYHCYTLKSANFEQYYRVLSINNALMPYASCNFNVILFNNVLMHILIIAKGIMNTVIKTS